MILDPAAAAQEKNLDGFWGKPTATIDWCEANYEVSYYIAEFWNTLSNISMIGLPLIGALFVVKDGLEKRYLLSFLALFVVGVGSWFFHGTLLYETQLLDELPMIWGSSVLIYTLANVSSSKPSKFLPVILFVYCVLVTVIYLTIKEPIFHEVAYGLMVFCMIYYSVNIVRHMKHSRMLFIVSLATYGLGFVVWNLDNILCQQARSIRSHVGYPLKPLLQGHAWWHLLAGTGTYLSILFSLYSRCYVLKNNAKLTVTAGVVPVVRVHQPSKQM